MTDTGWLLDATRGFVGRYVHFDSDAQRDAVALWVAHTHTFGAAVTSPRLAALSAEKQSGKTRLLEVLKELCAGSVQTCNMSEAFLFRRIAQGNVTILLDEVDTVFAEKGEQHEGLRGLLNAGYRVGATVGRIVGAKMEAVEFPVFAPVALAGLGNLPDTVQDRAIVLRMRRKAPDEEADRFRVRGVAEQAEALAADLSAVGWAGDAEPDRRVAGPA